MSNNGKNKGNSKKKNETSVAKDSERAELEREALAFNEKYNFINLSQEIIKKMDDRELMKTVTYLKRRFPNRNSNRGASNRRSFAPPNLPIPTSSRFLPSQMSRSRLPDITNSSFAPPPTAMPPPRPARGAMNTSASSIRPTTFFSPSAIIPAPRGRNQQMYFGTLRGNFSRSPYHKPSSDRNPMPGGKKRKATKKKKRKIRKRKTKKRKIRKKRKTKKRN